MTTPTEDAKMEEQGPQYPNNNEQENEREGADLETVETLTGKKNNRDDLNPEAEKELAQLKSTLQNKMQHTRMQHHAFEPVSLPGSQPVSRVPSGAATPSRRHLHAGSHEASPKISPPSSTLHSPPLTPAATKSRDQKNAATSVPPGARHTPDTMTPQRSTSPQRQQKPDGAAADASGAVSSQPKPSTKFSIGPGADSEPGSRDGSPTTTPAPGTPKPSTHGKRASTQQSANDAQYRFGNRDPAAGFSTSGQAPISLPGMPGFSAPPAMQVTQSKTASSTNSSLHSDNKRSSWFGAGKKEHEESSSKLSDKDHGGSKSNLKRFFKFGDHKHSHGSHHKEEKKTNTNGSGADGGDKSRASSIVAGNESSPSVPFADDHGLQSKYGKFGKMLGSGAGGSVRLMKRTGDGVVFAVKQFRDRHTYESEKEYNKKVTAEFCIGSTLHHGNIIETIDIVNEKGRWYEVMEYAPFDLFATVMTGKMGREEIACTTLQILSGVLYLHSMGLAHRDLKLDNVVISEHGIMKLIDFGSAVVFRYPFENEVVLATGVVGSDPYLAPEVYDNQRYDPRLVDIWSIAIIFCCMILRRFPWKAPRMSDNSYRLFVSQPDPDQDKILSSHQRTPTSGSNKTGASSNADSTTTHSDSTSAASSAAVSRTTTAAPSDQPPSIKGPIRLLRLLPRETRHIIGRMLEVDPRKRATMDDILADPWVQNSLVCRQEENGVVIRAPNHTHALQPSSSGK